MEQPDQLHGKIARTDPCAACHPDHHGEEFDPTEAAWVSFDHALAQFSLINHQVGYDATPVECEACHRGPAREASNTLCAVCHMDDDREFILRHTLDFSEDCLACHDGTDRMTHFDHSTTRFPLDGRHSQADCASCHSQIGFTGVPRACAYCHREPEVHAGAFDQECAACHTAQVWSPALLEGVRFSHSQDTSFDLTHHLADFDDQALKCQSCHLQDLYAGQVAACKGCHQQNKGFMDTHTLEYGSACLQCHDGVDRMRGFDHAALFALTGQHQDLACSACHLDFIYLNTPFECVGCHSEPELHRGEFGLQCHYCHEPRAWSPARLGFHIFPIDHGDPAGLACQACHQTNYSSYSCYGCHEHEESQVEQSHIQAGIAHPELHKCESCHSDGLIHNEGS